MRIAAIGAGGIAVLSALLAATRGHDVALWAPRGAPRLGRQENDRLILRSQGALTAAATPALLPDVAALADWPVLLLTVPGDAYPTVLPALLPVLRSDHTVICSGALSLVPLWLREQLARRGVAPRIVAWGTTLGTARPRGDRILEVGTVRERFELATLPAAEGPALMALCTDAFGDRFSLVGSLLIPLLSNINPIAHAGEVIPNLARIDRGEAWQLFANFTETGARIATAIDRERMAVAAAFGLEVRSLARHYHLSYHVPEGPVAGMAAAIEAQGRGPRGPASLRHRYLDEDMPYGLVVVEALGRLTGVATPHLSAAVTLLSAAADRDFRAANPLLTDLGLAPGGAAQEAGPHAFMARCQA